MSSDASRAAVDGSRASLQLPSLGVLTSTGLRGAFALTALAGVLLLLVGTFATVSRIKAVTTSDLAGGQTEFSGWDLHGPALVLLGLVTLVLLVGALRGARPAAIGAASCAGLVLLLLLTIDLPKLDDTRDLSRSYEGLSAGAAGGFYVETAGAVLLLLGVGGVLLVGARASRPTAAPAAAPAPAAEPQVAPADDWFKD